MKFIGKTGAALLLLPCAAFAADTGQWSSVQTLRPGDRIGVIQTDQKRVEGRFASATDTSIRLAGDGAVTIASTDVIRVYVRPRLTRTTRIIIGAGIGLVAGAIINATAGERFRNEGGDLTAGALLGGAGVGAGIGALSGGGCKTVYQSPRP